jgi:hypothetical protein
MAGRRSDRWTLSARAIRNQIDRAALRTTLMYAVHPRVDVGIEYNPKADQASPLLNVRVLTETRAHPAIMLGTSSDRIGTPEGQSFYVTAAKDLRPHTGLPVAPYVGVAYGTYEDQARVIAGANIAFGRGLSSLLIFDGVHFHPTLSYFYGRHGVSVLLVRSTDLGVSYNLRF